MRKTDCITISVPKDLLKDLDAISTTTGAKRSTVACQMIQRGFAHMKIVEAEMLMTPEQLLKSARCSYDKALKQTTLPLREAPKVV